MLKEPAPHAEGHEDHPHARMLIAKHRLDQGPVALHIEAARRHLTLIGVIALARLAQMIVRGHAGTRRHGLTFVIESVVDQIHITARLMGSMIGRRSPPLFG